MIDEAVWLRWALRSARNDQDLESILIDTGIDAVDSDHRVLLRYVAELNLQLEGITASNLTEEAVAAQARLLEDFSSYAAFHFRNEEALIGRLGAPGLEQQIREHRRILATLEELKAEFRQGRSTIPAALRRSVFTWVVSHIAEVDRHSFTVEGLVPAFSQARSWDDLADVIRTTGIDPLDAEHRRIVDLVLAVSASMRDQGGRADRALVADLRAVSAEHFDHEEELLVLYGAANLAEQREAHRWFLETLDRLAERCGDGPAAEGDCGDTVGLLSWFTNHIGMVDYQSFRRDGWLVSAFEAAREPSDLVRFLRATGQPLVDGEHRRFLELVFGILRQGLGSKDIPEADPAEDPLEFLFRFAEAHFLHEEGLFRQVQDRAGTRLLARHIEEHRSLTASLRELRSEVSGNPAGLTDALLAKLVGWWIHHTNGTDIETFGSAVLGRPSHG